MEVKTFDHIHYFKPKEITKTGAKLKDVQAETILKIDAHRNKTGLPTYICPNGITTGTHKSIQHKNGQAIDIYYKKPVVVKDILRIALEVEFRGIGAYYNTETNLYSFHFDLGPEYRFWSAWKIKRTNPWTYGALILDPRDLAK